MRQLDKGYSYDGAIGAKGPTRGVITSRGIALVGGLVRRPAWTRPIVVKPSSVGERREMLESVGVSSGGCSSSRGGGSVARSSGGRGFDTLASGGGGGNDPARHRE